MKKLPSRSFRPGVEALEARWVPAFVTHVGGVLGSAQAQQIQLSPTLDSLVKTRPNGRQFLSIDGSDYSDRVKILHYLAEGTDALVRVRLERLHKDTVVFTLERVYLLRQVDSVPIRVLGRHGNDTITNNTSAAMEVNAGEGNDTIVGGSGNDSLSGDGGDDKVYGGAGRGSDTLLGADGNDTLYGQGGRDRIFGGFHNDTCFGDAGQDEIFGNAGDDHLYGGESADFIMGNEGDDYLDGGRGSDKLLGNAGNDTLVGRAGSDGLDGGDGDDKLYGGADRDRLYGYAGVDELYGGADSDYLDGGYKSSPNINVGDLLVGGEAGDTFVRHKSVLGSDDLDVFADYNSATGDKIEKDWHP